MNNLLIGKRITVGQIVFGIMTALAFIWDALNPENKMSAGPLMAVSQGLTGVAQVIIANKFGVTLPKKST